MDHSLPFNMNLKRLDQAMDAATRYSDWLDLARQHDALSEADLWRERNRTNLYDYVEIQTRRDKLKKYLDEGANRELLYALNEGVHGNMGGMGKPILYNRAKCGTKYLIDDYVSVICPAAVRRGRADLFSSWRSARAGEPGPGAQCAVWRQCRGRGVRPAGHLYR